MQILSLQSIIILVICGYSLVFYAPLVTSEMEVRVTIIIPGGVLRTSLGVTPLHVELFPSQL